MISPCDILYQRMAAVNDEALVSNFSIFLAESFLNDPYESLLRLKVIMKIVNTFSGEPSNIKLKASVEHG
jgi:hypothetical protein